MNECKLWRAIAKPTCLSRVTFSFIDICVQANKMPKGHLFKATEEGDIEASIGAIRATGQLQTMHRPPIRLSPSPTWSHQHIYAYTQFTYTRWPIHTLTPKISHKPGIFLTPCTHITLKHTCTHTQIPLSHTNITHKNTHTHTNNTHNNTHTHK